MKSNIWGNLRMYGAIYLLVAASFYHNVTRLRNSAVAFVNRPNVDEISSFEMRFAPVKKALSANQCKQIGYLTDNPEDASWFGEYFKTQYALAPVIIGSSADFPVVVTNLHSPYWNDNLFKNRCLSLVNNYGNGVCLLKRSK